MSIEENKKSSYHDDSSLAERVAIHQQAIVSAHHKNGIFSPIFFAPSRSVDD